MSQVYERYEIFQSIFQISIDIAEREAHFRDVGRRRSFRYFLRFVSGKKRATFRRFDDTRFAFHKDIPVLYVNV